MNERHERIRLSEKIGYSLGDLGGNMAFQMMMIYQLKFYTDVFGLEGALAGTVLFVAPLLTAFVDPLVGIATDRTHTRWGMYRPWVLWTALPFCLFYVLAFFNPGIESKPLVALYATISYVLLLSVYSFNNTPYSSLGGVITSDAHERTSLTSIRFVASTVAQFIVQGLTLPLVDHFGAGNAQRGWTTTITLFGLVAVCCFVVTFLSTRERIAPPPQQTQNIRKDASTTFGNKAWRTMFFLTLLLFVTLAMFGSAVNYYFQNYLDAGALSTFLNQVGFSTSHSNAYSIGFSLFNTVNAVVQLLGVLLLSGYMSDHLGKKTTYLLCLSLTTLFTALHFVPAPDDVAAIYALGLLKSLAYAPTVPLMWVMVADVADYIEYQNGRRATGFCFSGIVFALKLGLGLGGALTGIILSGFGYIPGAAAAQPASAVTGIRLAVSLVPALLFGLATLTVAFYPITTDVNERMQRTLEERRKTQTH